MTESSVKYTAEEITEIFKEQHRLCSPVDPEADPWAEISPEMTIREWRWANDLVGWQKLGEFLNREFRIDIPEEKWLQVLEPAETRKLREVCSLIANYAVKDIYKAKTLFGKPCFKAGVFLTIKKNLKDKGVDVSELRPCSFLADFMNRSFAPVLEEITLTGTKPIDKIEIRRRKKGFWNAINIFDPDRYEIMTGEITTFRELTEKIIEEKTKLGTTTYKNNA